MEQKHHELRLEFFREKNTPEPFARPCKRLKYVLRHEDGTYSEAYFPWGRKVLNDLAELAKPCPNKSAVQRLGNALRSFLSKMEGWGREEERITLALSLGLPVHLSIRSAAAELYSLPWELLTRKTTGQFMGEIPGCLFRYEWPGARLTSQMGPAASTSGRILFAWSAAGGAFSADAHVRALQQAYRQSIYSFEPKRDIIPHVSLKKLTNALSGLTEPVEILHLLCHGAQRASGRGLLWNSSEPGRENQLVDAAALRQILAPFAATLRLIVICACHSGDAGLPEDDLGSIAQSLDRIGVRAVVASRYPLTTKGAVQFTETFYGALLGHSAPLMQAWAAARSELRRGDLAQTFDWASLQLYTVDDSVFHASPFPPPAPQIARESFVDSLPKRIEIELSALNELQLQHAAAKLGTTTTPWQPERVRVEIACAIARAVVEKGMTGVKQAINALAPTLRSQRATSLLALLAPLWVEKASADLIFEVERRPRPPSWSLGLNGKRVSTFTARMYVHRAYWPDSPCDVFSIAGGWGEDFVGHVRDELLEHVRASRNFATPEEADDYLKVTSAKIFVTLPPPAPDAAALDALRDAYPAATFILSTGEVPPQPEAVPPHVEILPILDLNHEIQAWSDYADAERLIRNFP